jgi:hypothetical protein
MTSGLDEFVNRYSEKCSDPNMVAPGAADSSLVSS